jgi:hypothetical protein
MSAFVCRSHLLTLAIYSILCVGNFSLAAPSGGFAVVLDKNQTQNGDSKRSLVFFDTDDMTAPLFGVFLGTEATSGTSASIFEDPDSITVDPSTGDVYVLAFDSGIPSDPQLIQIEPDGDIDGRGDYDLLKVDFRSAYDHWAANFQGSGTYVTYGDGSSAFDGSHTNPQVSPTVVDKIGEIGRSPGDGDFFASHLEFIDSSTLAYIDSNTQDGFGNPDVGGANDAQIRLIKKVAGPALPSVGGTEGGFNNNTSEAWESSLLGTVNLDGSVASDVVSIAAVRNRDGVTGLWVLENDGVGDQLAFFDFATASYRPIDTYGSPDRYSIANNPSLTAFAADGDGDQVLVDPMTGDVVIVESGFGDAHQPNVYKMIIANYDNSGAILPTGFTTNQAVDTTSIYDDGSSLVDGRYAIYDWTKNVVYFYDKDNSADTLNGGQSFTHDWYMLDLTTGSTMAVGPDADLTGLFDIAGRSDDQVEFFNLAIPEPSSILVLLTAGMFAVVRRRH